MFRQIGIIKKAGLIIVSILLSLFIAELVVRLIYPQQTSLYVWQPNLHHTFKPDSSIFCGISGNKNFTVNSHGMRGDVFTSAQANYLFMGGSTTECLYLDDEETWWKLLKNDWSGNWADEPMFASIGKSGCTTREHYIQLKYFVPQVKEANTTVVLMCGLNDMMKALSHDVVSGQGFRFTPEMEDSFVNTIFLKKGRGHEEIWWRNTALFYTLQQVLHKTQKVDWQNLQDDSGQIYRQWRHNRRNALAIIDTLPDLTQALDEYERNLKLICREAKTQGLSLTCISQPVIYKDSMDSFEQNLLWMGGKGDFQKTGRYVYYSTKALNQALKLYNQRLQKICEADTNIVFIDLAAQLPRDTSVFYDDCHFNEKGAQQVAAIVADGLFKAAKNLQK